ncbi:hypothetical protein [Botrimarina hoheduenensis]|uniref:Uncharacterized protein n=1 Tax=Botrimarina hoheduenensis TaxID=2528000 RepID=A0A5C5WE90_9BACT|nr:hypothetical protein [Botrimarina hoheduenensis]TWT48381.1 hypothetical protein Pla111_01440 [Botrimarina hoheduenensis]
MLATHDTFIRISDLIRDFLPGVWKWFDSLNRDEWLVVLAVFCAVGFLIIRGLGGKRAI